MTPLDIAIKQQDFETVKLFLEKGANPNKCDVRGHTPIYYALHLHNSAHILGLLLCYNADPNVGCSGIAITMLQWSALYHDVEYTRLLIEAGADVNLTFGWGTALHSSIRHDNIPVVRFLLESGANPNITDYDGKTPLDYAIKNKTRELQDLLTNAGAKTSKELLESTSQSS